MPQPGEAIAGAFVVGEDGAGYLSVFPGDLVLFRAKRTVLRKPKATDEAAASRARPEIRSAEVDKAGALQIEFADGSSWQFEVGSDQLTGAQQIVAELAASGPT